jgi:hypothetical protein
MEESQGAVATRVAPMAQHNDRIHIRHRAHIPQLHENEGRQANEQRAISTKMKGRTRLLQILISEASHLIWVLRYESVIHRS